MANPNIVAVATIEGGNLGWNLTNTLTTQFNSSKIIHHKKTQIIKHIRR